MRVDPTQFREIQQSSSLLAEQIDTSTHDSLSSLRAGPSGDLESPTLEVKSIGDKGSLVRFRTFQM
jgi:hypothetical protein